jgi:hypothetical protein
MSLVSVNVKAVCARLTKDSEIIVSPQPRTPMNPKPTPSDVECKTNRQVLRIQELADRNWDGSIPSEPKGRSDAIYVHSVSEYSWKEGQLAMITTRSSNSSSRSPGESGSPTRRHCYARVYSDLQVAKGHVALSYLFRETLGAFIHTRIR